MGWDNMEKRLFKVSCGGGASGVPGKPGTCFPLFATGKKQSVNMVFWFWRRYEALFPLGYGEP